MGSVPKLGFERRSIEVCK